MTSIQDISIKSANLLLDEIQKGTVTDETEFKDFKFFLSLPKKIQKEIRKHHATPIDFLYWFRMCVIFGKAFNFDEETQNKLDVLATSEIFEFIMKEKMVK